MGDTKRAVGYLRVSTVDQHLGPEAQRASIEAWAVREGVTICAWHEDRVSGAAEVSDRPALVRALADLRELACGTLIAAKRDRVGRDPIVVAVIEREARTAGAIVRTADGASDGAEDDEGAVLRRGVEDLFSKVERMRIRKRTTLALAVKAARGERVGGIPYGMRLADDGVHLEPDDAEQAIIAAARALVAAGLSLSRVSLALAERGMVNRAGKPFSKCALHLMLKRANGSAAAA